MLTARQALIYGTQRLAAAGIDSARTDAELLLCHVLGVKRPRLLLVDDLNYEQRMSFERLIGARQARVPLQHLTGIAPFRYLELEIGPGALVPRPETEVVVEAALRWIRECGITRPLLLDLCSGAAPIALAMATELEQVDVVAVEKYPEAQAWGRRNAERVAATIAARGNQLEFLDADVCDLAALHGFEQRAAAIVSNPPYIPEGMVPRDPEVLQHDPHVALFGGADGFDVIRGLLDSAAMCLLDGGYLVVEHADAQGEPPASTAGSSTLVAGSLPELIRQHGAFVEVQDHRDLADRPRYTTAIRRAR
ncbi:MAG: N5-glutamine methyltransferase family protein [Candidatus Nanopelagicales bacterium]